MHLLQISFFCNGCIFNGKYIFFVFLTICKISGKHVALFHKLLHIFKTKAVEKFHHIRIVKGCFIWCFFSVGLYISFSLVLINDDFRPADTSASACHSSKKLASVSPFWICSIMALHAGTPSACCARTGTSLPGLSFSTVDLTASLTPPVWA